MSKTVLKTKYFSLISLVSSFFLVELIVGTHANSIVLQTDAFHMLSDLMALIVGVSSVFIAERAASSKYTYGWTRAEIIGGFVNSVFLLTICFTLLIEIVEKFILLIDKTENPELDKEVDLVLIVASVGLVINIVGVALFWGEHTHSHGHSHGGHDGGHGHGSNDSHGSNDDRSNDEDIDVPVEVLRQKNQESKIQESKIPKRKVLNHNQYAVLLHVLGDALGSIVAIISTLAIKYLPGNWKYFLDPLGSLVIITIISISSCKLLFHTIRILMHRWDNITGQDFLSEIKDLPGVDDIHEFHVWPLNNRVTIASMHIRMNPETMVTETETLLSTIKGILHNHGIHSSTLQPEWAIDCIEPACAQDCSGNKCCQENLPLVSGQESFNKRSKRDLATLP